MNEFVNFISNFEFNSYYIHELIGWIGAVCFAICGLPQARECYQRGNAEGINLSFINLWFFGEVLTLYYILPDKKWPLIFNYILNLICILFILRYKFFPRYPVKRDRKTLRENSEQETK